MRSTDSAESASIASSRARTAFGVAPTERIQAPTEIRSRRSASGCDHGSSGSTPPASFANPASAAS